MHLPLILSLYHYHLKESIEFAIDLQGYEFLQLLYEFALNILLDNFKCEAQDSKSITEYVERSVRDFPNQRQLNRFSSNVTALKAVSFLEVFL